MHNLCDPCVNSVVLYDPSPDALEVYEGCTCQHNWGVWMRIYDRLDFWRCVSKEELLRISAESRGH